MKVYQDEIKIKTAARVTYQNITGQLKQIVKNSAINNGICLVQTPHTSMCMTRILTATYFYR